MARFVSWLNLVAVFPLALACSGDDGGGDGGTAADTGSGGGTASSSADDAPLPPDLPVPKEPVTTVFESLVPFDANREDLAGPGSWDTNYGKSPEIVVVPQGLGMAVYAQNYDTTGEQKSILLRIEPSVDDYVITGVVEPPFLDRIMGMDHDGGDNIYVASGIIDSEIDATYPALNEYRPGIVSVVATNWDGEVNFEVDLDPAREAFDQPELLVNPMVAATSRLVYGASTVALLHGNNTDPDEALDGARHQKAMTTHLHAVTGAITRSSSMWVSHSFDQRMFYDGSGFIEMHLGDAYPRYVAFGSVGPGNPAADSGAVPLFHIKGALGENVTRTEIGDVARIGGSGEFGYLAVFIAERTASEADLGPAQANIAGTRELAMVRIKQSFASTGDDELNHLDASMPDTLDVSSSGMPRTNRLRWLTNYDAEGAGTAMVERAKVVATADDEFIVMWERHEFNGSGYVFAGTHAMTLNAAGEVAAGPQEVSQSRLPRGDDAFLLEGGAAFMTGDSQLRELQLHLIAPDLTTRLIVIQ